MSLVLREVDKCIIPREFLDNSLRIETKYGKLNQPQTRSNLKIYLPNGQKRDRELGFKPDCLRKVK